jgi:hypothetical protein
LVRCPFQHRPYNSGCDTPSTKFLADEDRDLGGAGLIANQEAMTGSGPAGRECRQIQSMVKRSFDPPAAHASITVLKKNNLM